MGKYVDVSVIIPAFNEEQYIPYAVNSLLKQTFKDFEVIIINDCSNDRTFDVIHSISDQRIKVITNETNRGVPYCMNKGIENSVGQYIARMDADDISMPERLFKQYEFMGNNKECVVVGTGIYYCNYRDGDFRRIIPVCDNKRIRKEMLTHNPINAGSVMYKKSAIEKVGGFDPKDKKAEGFSLLIKMSSIGELRNISDPEYVYFIRPGSGNRSAQNGFRSRNKATSIMLSRAGSLFNCHFQTRVASFMWNIYHHIPRFFQILIRNLVSHRKDIKLTQQEIHSIEVLYESAFEKIKMT